MIEKRILLTLALFFLGAATSAHAMEETATALGTTENRGKPVTTLELLPRDMWKIIAQKLPGSDPFLNRLGRHIPLDDSCYEKIIEALLHEIERFPRLAEIPHLIDRYLKTTHSYEVNAKILKAFVAFIRNHRLSGYSCSKSDIWALRTYILDSLDSSLLNNSGEIDASLDSISQKSVQDLHEIRDKVKAAIMYVGQLDKLYQMYYEDDLKGKSRSINASTSQKLYIPQLTIRQNAILRGTAGSFLVLFLIYCIARTFNLHGPAVIPELSLRPNVTSIYSLAVIIFGSYNSYIIDKFWRSGTGDIRGGLHRSVDLRVFRGLEALKKRVEKEIKTRKHADRAINTDA